MPHLRTLIVYHEVKPGVACADGISAAWVAKRKYPDADLKGASYGAEFHPLPDYNHLVIVDFSFPLAQLNEWVEQGRLVQVIDHHKTAMADLSSFENAVFDMDESGATLAWKTFFPDQPIPAFLEYVKDRDLWNFNLPDSEEVHEAMAFMGRSFYQLDQLAKFTTQELRQVLVPLGKKLLEPKRKRIAELAATAHDALVLGYQCKAVEIPEGEARLVSDTCAAIYKQYPDAAFVVSYSWKSEEKIWALGFRSDKNGNNFDVSEIARQFEGGGHRNAAGGKVDKLRDLF